MESTSNFITIRNTHKNNQSHNKKGYSPTFRYIFIRLPERFGRFEQAVFPSPVSSLAPASFQTVFWASDWSNENFHIHVGVDGWNPTDIHVSHETARQLLRSIHVGIILKKTHVTFVHQPYSLNSGTPCVPAMRPRYASSEQHRLHKWK